MPLVDFLFVCFVDTFVFQICPHFLSSLQDTLYGLPLSSEVKQVRNLQVWRVFCEGGEREIHFHLMRTLMSSATRQPCLLWSVESFESLDAPYRLSRGHQHATPPKSPIERRSLHTIVSYEGLLPLALAKCFCARGETIP